MLRLLSTTEKRIWLGIHDSEKEGIFVDTEGNPIKYEAWRDGEPNDLNGEDAAEINNGEWNDQSVNDKLYVPCVLYPPKGL